MNELKHWQEEGAPSDFQRLLRAAQGERPASQSLQRALVATGVVGATTLASGAAAGAAGNAAGKVMLGALSKWFAIGVMGAGAVIATTEIVRDRAPASVATRPRASLPGAPALKSNGGTPHARPASVPSAAVEVDRAPSGDATSAAARATPPLIQPPVEQPLPVSAANADRTLLEEMKLIDAARSSLRAGDASGSLRSAVEYSRRFPAGRFAPEALFLVMQAESQLGHGQAAAAVAREIVRRYPTSAQVGRARELLQSQGGSENP